MKGCEGVCEGVSKVTAKALTCASKGSKGFLQGNAHKKTTTYYMPYAGLAPSEAFDPFEAQVNPYADPFAHPFAIPSHPFAGGAR